MSFVERLENIPNVVADATQRYLGKNILKITVINDFNDGSLNETEVYEIDSNITDIVWGATVIPNDHKRSVFKIPADYYPDDYFVIVRLANSYYVQGQMLNDNDINYPKLIRQNNEGQEIDIKNNMYAKLNVGDTIKTFNNQVHIEEV